MSYVLPAPLVERIANEFSTPVWVYDAQIIKKRIDALRSFDVIRFAQKACSNIHILKIMREQGVKVDAVSAGEIQRALTAGFHNESPIHAEIVYTADIITHEALELVIQHQIPVNAGSIDVLRQLGHMAKGHSVWLRINPGFGHGHSQKTNTGGENSKHGIWHTDLTEALEVIAQYQLNLVGIHMHIGSGVDYTHLQEVCGAMLNLVKQVHTAGHDIHAISAGGGLSIPYQEDAARIDTDHYFKLWDDTRQTISKLFGHAITLEIEPGRYLVAESGSLITQVLATKDMGSNHFVLVDAGFNELMRPAMYGSYHGMTVLSQHDTTGEVKPSVVAGPLCESGDVFTQEEGGIVRPRDLAPAHVGDLLIIHDTGAYGASMSSNYNTRPLCAEVLLENGSPRLIRRRQTIEELINLELDC